MVKLHILNSAGTLSKYSKMIEQAFETSLELPPTGFINQGIDVIFQDLASWAVPELGIVGHTYSGHIIHISLDPKHEIKKSDIVSTLVHEFHHAVRWQKIGFGTTLGDLIINEGLACLFEQELTGEAPIYTRVKVSDSNASKIALELMNDKYDRGAWFFGTNKNIPRWFGYSYGYNLCKVYANKHNLTAAEMVAVNPEVLLIAG